MRLFRNGKASLERLDTTARNFPFSLFTLPQILRVPRPVFPTRFCLFYPEIFPAAPNQHRPLLDLRREPGNTGPPPLLVVCSHIHSKTACRGVSERQWRSAANRSRLPPRSVLGAPHRETAPEPAGETSLSALLLGFPICSHLPATVPIPSSTQNAPGFAFFGLNRCILLFLTSFDL